MSSYILRGCLGFNPIMMFVCHGNAVFSECGGSGFICSQWERKIINTDVSPLSAVWDQRQML